MSQPPASPKIEGMGPIIRRFDDPDVPFQPVRAQRNADGTESYVREKWFAFSNQPQYLSLYATYDPGMVVRRHGHFSPHIVFVLEGDLWVGDEHCPKGTHVELPLGAAFGPLVACDDGCVLFEVMMGDPRSFQADPEGYERFLAERNVQQLPNPPIDMPTGLEDTRSEP